MCTRRRRSRARPFFLFTAYFISIFRLKRKFLEIFFGNFFWKFFLEIFFGNFFGNFFFIFFEKMCGCGHKNWGAGAWASHYKNVCVVHVGADEKPRTLKVCIPGTV
jgi:hypothetical protein